MIKIKAPLWDFPWTIFGRSVYALLWFSFQRN